MINEPTYIPAVTNLPTTQTAVSFAEEKTEYTWAEMNVTWDNALFTWDAIKLQKPPIGTAVVNLPIL